MHVLKISVLAGGLAVLCLSTNVSSAWAEEPKAAPVATASAPTDKDWAAFQAALNAALPANIASLTPSQWARMVDQCSQAIAAAALTYYKTHPADPRRWDAARKYAYYCPSFYKSFKQSFDAEPGPANAVIDTAAKAAWESRSAELIAAMRAAPDVPPDDQEWLAGRDMFEAVGIAYTARSDVMPADWSALHGRLVAFSARFPQSAQAASVLGSYMYSYEGCHTTTESAAEWKSFVASPNPKVVEIATKKAASFDLLENPIDVKFIAADGRNVDLARLHGKVVLIDFWATWCGPCKAEIPSVVAAYKKYHNQGFEVVGITLERAGVKADDPAETAESKLAAAKKKMLDFTATHNMPWPQYYDGKGFKNEIAAKYDIPGIPAMFFVDKNGSVVSTNARGPELEKLIGKYLAL